MKWLSAPWRKDDSKKRDGSTSTDASTKARPRIPPDFPDTVRRLNHLVDRLGVTRYLEIGLGNGGTFDGVEAPHKVGVDPHPWNRDLHDIGGVHILTSDEYFRRHWDDGQRFDLILLDGLHTAEQTYRDFVNSLHFAHANTVWLIDDVMPNDAFSAIPDQAESIRQRKATGSDNTAWHGDVYKVVWMIRTFHRGMRLRTFSKQQPQSLVYYPNAAGVTPGLDMTFGEIAQLTFEDTLVRRAVYDIGDECDILDECIETIRQRAK